MRETIARVWGEVVISNAHVMIVVCVNVTHEDQNQTAHVILETLCVLAEQHIQYVIVNHNYPNVNAIPISLIARVTVNHELLVIVLIEMDLTHVHVMVVAPVINKNHSFNL
jgi:hypothetical protein